MAIWVMAVVAVAPCQCFSLGGIQTTSPGRISSTGPSQRCTRPQPAVTIRIWPSGWVCHAVRAPGSKVTLAPTARAGSFAWNKESMRTVPVKYSADPLVKGCEPLNLMSILSPLFGFEPYLYYLLQCWLIVNIYFNRKSKCCIYKRLSLIPIDTSFHYLCSSDSS